MKIHSLFPQAVYFSTLERALTEEELKTIDEYKKKTKKNSGNKFSTDLEQFTTDSYVLKHKTLKNLKEDLTTKIKEYFNEIVCTKDSITPYITQSWFKYTETGQFHHSHHHLNSYLSGIFYIRAKKEVDEIIFNKSNDRQLALIVTKPNPFNAMSCRLSVKTGDVILFPSTLEHEVLPKKGTDLRISLSFNVFVKGTLGCQVALTELILE
jgi:uncharacterized protein (TIGR02466 family)